MATTPTTGRAAPAPAAPSAPLAPAAPGDQLTVDDLHVAFRFLMDQADALDAEVARAPDVATQQQIGRLQNDLFKQAAALNARSLDLLAGEARITAAHIESAVAAAQSAIDDVNDLRVKMARLGAVLVFVGAVLTGHGGTIVKGARVFKDALEGPPSEAGAATT